MNHKIKKCVLTASGLLALTACSSTPTEPPAEPKMASAVAFNEGVPGGMELHAVELSAVVKNINYATREVLLEGAQGQEKLVTVPAETANFQEIKQGDTVSITLIEEMVVQMLQGDVAQESIREAVLVGSAKPGNKPQVIIVDKVAVKVKVKAVDLAEHSATLIFPDGSTRTVPVRKDVALDESRVGQELIIYTTKALLLSVKKL